MEFLGVGWQELIFIFLIALIVLVPKDMQKAGKTIVRLLNQLIRSDGWKALQQTSRELRKLPTTLMREANLDLDETERAIRQGMDLNPRRSPPPSTDRRRAPSNEPENSIQPPVVKPPSQPTDSEKSGTETERHE